MVSETAILGGGLAGGAAALLLARGGARVRLLEREAEPHDKVCGEFLSIEAQRDLARLGLDTARLGAVPIEHLRLCAGGTRIEARLPFVAQDAALHEGHDELHEREDGGTIATFELPTA